MLRYADKDECNTFEDYKNRTERASGTFVPPAEKAVNTGESVGTVGTITEIYNHPLDDIPKKRKKERGPQPFSLSFKSF